MSLKEIAQATLSILEAGQYVSNTGKIVVFADAQSAAVQGTRLYTPEQGAALLAKPLAESDSNSFPSRPAIEVTDETTQTAARRLVQNEGCANLVLLNYASARNPGGGFINGAKAQEEDLSRCSGLYPCLLTQPTYYQVNRAQDSLLYTDHVIYSPKVPWFRTHSRELIEDVFLASVITAPAPNAGQVLRRNPQARPEIESALRRRAGIVLAIARAQGHRSLLLGAWGCGVFRNDPDQVADAFGQWLAAPQFQGCFDRVVFGVYDPTQDQRILQAFQDRF
ncbi:MAG: TIGR02452 family protein [Cyanobacteria bacterium P01_A01_bin.114]